ncbi:hypothetical protein BDZ97DRAFT_905169 [Flammula alnicola]|nr:hypothetical protein BDZ97DRAFT_905169 [Flammula alnicola]
MDRNEPERQSSLPRSLLPHLYTAPQQPRDSSTRTTLDPDDPNQLAMHYQQHPVSPVLFPFVPPRQQHRSSHSFLYDAPPLDTAGGTPAPLPDLSRLTSTIPPQRFGSPIYSDPLFHSSSRPNMSSRNPSYTFPPPLAPREYMSQRMAWSDGEAGPSSLMHPGSREGRNRRGSSLSPRVASHSDAFGRGDTNYEHESGFGDVVRRDAERDPYFSLPGLPVQHHQPTSYFPHSPQNFQGVPPPPQLLLPDSDEAFSFRHEPYPYPPVGNLSLSTSPPGHFRSPSRAESSSMYRSDSLPGDLGSTDDGGSRDSKRRRAESVDDDNSRKQRKPRKTAVACNFCRGRKLRCNGARPTCSHCTARKLKCEYVSTPRRRGPGKAPRGSRPRKASASRVVPEYELDALAPELRPYTSVMSLSSLDTFSFQPTSAPRYPSAPDPELMREYYARTRTPRSRETSSEDRSDAERNE